MQQIDQDETQQLSDDGYEYSGRDTHFKGILHKLYKTSL